MNGRSASRRPTTLRSRKARPSSIIPPVKQTQWQSQQEQEQPPQRKGPPAGWRYYAQAKHRSRLRGWLAQVWRGAKNNAALVSLVGVMLTLLVTTVLTQQGWVNQQKLESQRAQAAAEVAEQQAQQESLQTYLGDMGELLLRDTSPLRAAEPGSEVSTLARAKTLTVLPGLDAQSKGILLRFLYEAALIQEGNPIVDLATADLSNADLSPTFDLKNANLSDADLRGADLKTAYLSDANLTNANLSNADLRYADLRYADLRFADLSPTDLGGADLRYADLSNADLSGAILRGAILRGANLNFAGLTNANLSKADLIGAYGVTKRELEGQDVRLQGATMPDGSKYP